MPKPTIAILFGGCSEEHDVSVRSAVEVAAAIDRERFHPVHVGITRAGSWLLCERPGPGWEARATARAVISPDRDTRGLLVRSEQGWEALHLDVVLPVLHGRLGEGGAIQGLLDLAGIPYVGCDLQSSAVCMDKALAYLLVRQAGIETPRFRVLQPGEEAAPLGLQLPVFVKPARSGSSFGVTRVDRPDDLEGAVSAARAFDAKVIVEEAVVGTEVGCAVLGQGDDLVVGEVDRITLRHGFFRIHQEAEPERGSENSDVTVPADLPPEQRARIRGAATAIYRALGCRGLARVDMFLRDDGGIVLNEVNTLPGFTTYSRYPRMMAAAGISLTEVIDRCVDAAMAG